MAHHVPNRRSLDDAEITELGAIMAEYDTAREKARSAMAAAQAAYKKMIEIAADRRDERILAIIDAAGGRGTQSRIGEHLGMNLPHFALRIRKARARIRATNDESATPQAVEPSG
jgi:hypothetical protein